jgi:hypothetical protein
MQVVEEQLEAVEKTLEAAAPKELPKGFGRLTFVLLLRELCNYRRFAHRRKVGGFTGLCGAVSSSGPCHLDMGINKAGSPYVRTLLIELAWRMVYWQSQYKALTKWQLLRDAGQLKNRRRRKIALVALARQLAVDIWRWQTGQVTPQALGWQMSTDDQARRGTFEPVNPSSGPMSRTRQHEDLGNGVRPCRALGAGHPLWRLGALVSLLCSFANVSMVKTPDRSLSLEHRLLHASAGKTFSTVLVPAGTSPIFHCGENPTVFHHHPKPRQTCL